MAGASTLGHGNFTSTSFVTAELFGWAEPQLQTHSFQQPLLSLCCCSTDHDPDMETREDTGIAEGEENSMSCTAGDKNCQMSPDFIGDQTQKPVWTMASMLNSNSGAFCCTPLAFRRWQIAVRVNVFWEQGRGWENVEPEREKVRNSKEERNETHVKRRRNQGVWMKN